MTRPLSLMALGLLSLPASAAQRLPLYDDFGAVVKTTGVGGETAAPAGTPARRMLHRVTLTGEHSTCLDQSPAVMYVRPAQTAAASDRWLIVLEGGGSGFSPLGTLDQGLWDRWTGGGSNPSLNWLEKSSTDWRDASTGAIGRDGVPDLPLQVVKNGILDGISSSFADWNLVYLNYCSSDGWAGGISGEVFNAGSFTIGGVNHSEFEADLNGHRIIDDALSMLEVPGAWSVDDPEQDVEMPSLSGAATVLIAGESAGGGGVLNNLDFMAEEIAATASCDVEVYGSIGASQKPPIPDSTDSWWYDSDGDGVSDLLQGALGKWAQMARISGFVDESCVLDLGAADAHLCQLVSSAVAHLETPVHIKQDMSDRLVGRGTPGRAEFQEGLETDYRAWIADSEPAFFAPDCDLHASLHRSEYFTDVLQQRELLAGGGVGAVVHDEVSYDESLRRFVQADGLVSQGAEQIFDDRQGSTAGGADYVWVSDCP